VTTCDPAVETARREWAVFPCRYHDKKPAVDRWEERAITDPERVARYWPPNANIGIACGPSRLVVVDLDTHGELPEDWRLPGIHDGRDVLAQLCEWADQPWPSTYMVRTPTGGWHLYFTAPGEIEIRNSKNKIGPMIDVRGWGGYVVAPPSVLDERAYPRDPQSAALVKGGKPYDVLDAEGPEPLPGWLAALAAPPPATPAAASQPGRGMRAAAGSSLDRLASFIRRCQPGDRNDPFFWASCRAAEAITAGEASQGDAEELLVRAALEAGLRGGEREARATFASAMRTVAGGGR
jgi:hypothetical protein